VSNQHVYAPPLPATSFSFSVLVTSPIRRNLKFCPVSAMILPLASVDLYFASMIIVGLDLLMSFLFKKAFVHPPKAFHRTPNPYPATLITLGQLDQLMHAAIKGQVPIPLSAPAPGQGFGPVGEDEPFFPDNLSVSLFVAAPFAPFDGSPDTSFTVPLFEVPGAPGNLLITLGAIIAQFLVERSGLRIPNSTGNGGSTDAFAVRSA
jgi:hypothetical protein